MTLMKQNSAEIPLEELERLERLIAGAVWIKTKKYPERMAHEYVMKKDFPQVFDALNIAIARYGFEDQFYSQRHRYVWIGEWKYWSFEELSSQLNIDAVELDALLDRAVQYDERKELAELLKDETQEELERDGIPASSAGIVAERHAMIASPSLLKQADGEQSQSEAYQNVRFEFVYSGEQAEFMREQVGKAGSGLKLLLRLCELSRVGSE